MRVRHALRAVARMGVMTGVMAGVLAAGSGCSSPTAILDAATTVAEDRSMKRVRDDVAIKIDINAKMLARKYRDLFLEVSTNVYEGKVMLTGTVKTVGERRRATLLAAEVEGVKHIFNELQVAEGSIEGTASDLWIETKLKARLVTERQVRSINYRWRAVNGVVYFIGAARSRAELVRVIETARDTRGVNKVVTHARLR